MRRRCGVLGACIVLVLFGSVAESANAGEIPAFACTHVITVTTLHIVHKQTAQPG